jgi:hypothetical protein
VELLITFFVAVHKSGQLETLLEDAGVIPKIELPEVPAKP